MPRRPGKLRKTSSANANIFVSGLHFIFEVIGATRPVRLGLAVALSFALYIPTDMLIVLLRLPAPNAITLAYSLFGLSFCIFFVSFLFSPPLPEPVSEHFVIIEQIAKRAGLNKSERRGMYRQLYNLILVRNGYLPKLDLTDLDVDLEKKMNDLPDSKSR